MRDRLTDHWAGMLRRGGGQVNESINVDESWMVNWRNIPPIYLPSPALNVRTGMKETAEPKSTVGSESNLVLAPTSAQQSS